jgi:hypothetical protein
VKKQVIEMVVDLPASGIIFEHESRMSRSQSIEQVDDLSAKGDHYDHQVGDEQRRT